MLYSEISAEQLHQALFEGVSSGSAADRIVVLFSTTEAMTETIPETNNIDVANENTHSDDAQKRSLAFIPKSQYFDFKNNIADKSSNLASTMPSASEFQEKVRAFGINPDSDIVVYDNIGNFYASRVWFMFKAMGHQRIRVLAGGLNAWLALEYETELSASTAQRLGSFIAKPNMKYQFVQRDFIQQYIVSTASKSDNDPPKLPLCDARSPGRFTGAEPEDRVWLRSGHIPSSTNLHYKRLQNDKGAFISLDALKQEFEQALKKNTKSDGITEQALAFTCGSGVTACILAQAAEALGYTKLYVYDGSWSEWGADESLAISTGNGAAGE